MRTLRWIVACTVVLGCAPREEFCQSNVICLEESCEPQGDSCITFEEASELANEPYSGVHTLEIRRDPNNTGAATPSPQNDDAICRNDTCYLRAAGKVVIRAVGSPGQQFVRWSGCSDSTNPTLELSNLRRDSECIAHFVPFFIVVTAGVTGFYDQHVQLSSSYGCSATDSCVTTYGGSMTLVAPSNPAYTFLGWAGCSTSKELTITLSNLTAPAACVAQYQAITHDVRWSAGAGGSVGLRASGPDYVCEQNRCSVVEGNQLVLEALPFNGYRFAGWSCDDSAPALLILRDVRADITCEARFESAQ